MERQPLEYTLETSEPPKSASDHPEHDRQHTEDDVRRRAAHLMLTHRRQQTHKQRVAHSLAGYLHKRSPAPHRWQKRYIVLADGRLLYYDTEQAHLEKRTAIASLNLRHARVAPPADVKDRGPFPTAAFRLDLDGTAASSSLDDDAQQPQRDDVPVRKGCRKSGKYVFATSTPEELVAWMQACEFWSDFDTSSPDDGMLQDAADGAVEARMVARAEAELRGAHRRKGAPES